MAVVLENQSPAEADTMWEKAINFRQQYLGKHAQVATHLLSRAALLHKLDRLHQSSSCYQQAISILEELNTEPDARLEACLHYAELLEQLNQASLADEYRQKAKAISIDRN